MEIAYFNCDLLLRIQQKRRKKRRILLQFQSARHANAAARRRTDRSTGALSCNTTERSRQKIKKTKQNFCFNNILRLIAKNFTFCCCFPQQNQQPMRSPQPTGGLRRRPVYVHREVCAFSSGCVGFMNISL